MNANPLLELEHQIPFGGLTGVRAGEAKGRWGRGRREKVDGRIKVGGKAKRGARTGRWKVINCERKERCDCERKGIPGQGKVGIGR